MKTKTHNVVREQNHEDKKNPHNRSKTTTVVTVNKTKMCDIVAALLSTTRFSLTGHLHTTTRRAQRGTVKHQSISIHRFTPALLPLFLVARTGCSI
jgi:hypothetical protein